MKRKIKIIDAIMGSGKTHNAIQEMKNHKGNFIYVTPFLDEVNRIIESVPKVKQPEVTYDYNEDNQGFDVIYKRANLLRLANNKTNLATTHNLFKKLHRSDYFYFKDYDLFLDEVITPIEIIKMSSDDIKIAFEQGLIIKNEKSGEVSYIGEDYNGKYYAHLKKLCDTSNVVYINNRLLVWAFPPEIFNSFKSVKVLTYLFEGSYLASYFNFYNISYSIEKQNIDEIEQKKKIKNLLNIYEGSCNSVGDYHYAFSNNWLRDFSKNKKKVKKLKEATANLLFRNFKTSSKETAFTVFKEYESKFKGKGYSNGFIAVNERATNKYVHKRTMIYFANQFINPNIKDFFNTKKIVVNEDKWALSELLQWIWRGRIRKNEPMNLFIPSKRMRELLKSWLISDIDTMCKAA